MIKQGDLRQNNIIKVKYEGHWRTVRVDATFRTFIIAKNPFTHIGMSHDYGSTIHGAAISIEWLVSYGWEQVDKTTVSHPKYGVLISKNMDSSFSFKAGKQSDEIMFSYLHELQNIFKAVLGVEMLHEPQIKAILSLE